MKHLIVFLPLLAISLSRSIGEATQQLVYDTEGHELSSHSQYYILLTNHEINSGISNVADDESEFGSFVGPVQGHDAAIPVQISPPSAGAVGLSTNLTISFYIASICADSTEWYVTELSPMSSSTEQTKHVAMGTMNTGESEPPSVFRVERYGETTEAGYKLVWCPDQGPCKDLGVQAWMEKNYLVTRDTPLAVVFKKADA